MLTAEHIDIFIVASEDYFEKYGDDECRDARAAARAQLALMRQPITAEALTAAGWFVTYKGISGDIYQCPTNKRIEVGIFDGESVFYLGRHGGVIPVPTTMYDLAELVRLLGPGGE